jgi:hypothetical protein
VDGARLAPLMLMAGLATGILTVAVHQRWWSLALGVSVALLLLLTAPRGWWTRLPYGLGFAGAVGLLAVPRPEGDYLIAADLEGFIVLGTAVVVLVGSVATLPRPRQSPAEE